MNEINKFTQNYHHGNFITPPPPAPIREKDLLKRPLMFLTFIMGEGT